MKKNKIFGSLIVALVPVLLTGCGKNNVLTCVQEESVSSLEVTSEFKDEEVKKVSIKAEFDFSDVNDVQFETSKNQDFCASFGQSFDNALKDCKQTVTGKLITVAADIDLDKYSKNLSGKIEEAKQDFEKQGFKCKIK